MLKTLLATHDVAYSTTTQKHFSNISVSIKENARIALVGGNGTGKTTFLKLLNGMLEFDSGTVTKNGRSGYVPQTTQVFHRQMCVDECLQSRGCSYVQFSSIYSHIFSSNVPEGGVKISEMSGGERTKLWIVLVASSKPQIVLLDEPTNHLDQKSIYELKQWINEFKGAVVFVSHQRNFLSDIARTIWELSAHKITVFGVGYTDYLLQKKHNTDARARQYEAVNKELRLLEKGVRMRETKAARAKKVQGKNKTEPSRSKSAENYFKNRSEKGVGKIKKKQDARLNELEESLQSLQMSSYKTINLSLDSRLRKGGLILEVKSLPVAIGSRVLINDVSLRIEYGDRIAILGDNGVGKTLLVKKLMKEIERPTPSISRVGTDICVSYIDQQYGVVNHDLTVFENLEHSMNQVNTELIYKHLGRFQFPDHIVHKKVRELSGGEIARLAFAIATIVPLDLLILDEPTNNLDIETLDIILSALNDFQGSLVVITHDMSFLEGLEITTLYGIEDGVLR